MHLAPNSAIRHLTVRVEDQEVFLSQKDNVGHEVVVQKISKYGIFCAKRDVCPEGNPSPCYVPIARVTLENFEKGVCAEKFLPEGPESFSKEDKPLSAYLDAVFVSNTTATCPKSFVLTLKGTVPDLDSHYHLSKV